MPFVKTRLPLIASVGPACNTRQFTNLDIQKQASEFADKQFSNLWYISIYNRLIEETACLKGMWR